MYQRVCRANMQVRVEIFLEADDMLFLQATHSTATLYWAGGMMPEELLPELRSIHSRSVMTILNNCLPLAG